MDDIVKSKRHSAVHMSFRVIAKYIVNMALGTSITASVGLGPYGDGKKR